jgi:hypothetical protein
MLELGNKIQEHLHFLSPEERDTKRALIMLLRSEYRRRLAHYENLNRSFERKYAVPFEEFEAKNVVREKDFSWEVESDAMTWEQAIDGIKTMRAKLEDLDAVE